MERIHIQGPGTPHLAWVTEGGAIMGSASADGLRGVGWVPAAEVERLRAVIAEALEHVAQAESAPVHGPQVDEPLRAALDVLAASAV